MTDEFEQPDPPLTQEQEAMVASLSDAFIRDVDRVLLSHSRSSWRKVAMLVGMTMMDQDLKATGLPDVFFSMRVRRLVEIGRLESAGNLAYMRSSEVRLPPRAPVEP
jgi:hypothetical protein